MIKSVMLLSGDKSTLFADKNADILAARGMLPNLPMIYGTNTSTTENKDAAIVLRVIADNETVMTANIS